MADKEKAPKNLYNLPRAIFTWYKPDTGYYWEREAIGFPFPLVSIFQRRYIIYGQNSDFYGEPKTVASDLWGERSAGWWASPFLLPQPNTRRMIPTYPLKEKPTLFQTFADLEPTEEEILKFANEHGALLSESDRRDTLGRSAPLFIIRTEPLSKQRWLSASVPDEIFDLMIEPLGRDYYNPREDDEFGERFSDWKDEIEEMKETVRVFRLLEKEDVESLGEIIKWDEENGEQGIFVHGLSRIHLPSRWLLIDETHDLFGSIPRGDVLIPGLILLMSKINRNLQSFPVGPTLRMITIGKAEPYLEPSSLLSAMWLQLYQHVVGEKQSKHCPLCGEWEDTTRKRPKWERHSACAAQVRATRSRIRGKAAEARRIGKISEGQAKAIENELSEAKTKEALRSVEEKFKSGLEADKPAKKKTAKSPTKKAKPKAAKKPAEKKAARGGKK